MAKSSRSSRYWQETAPDEQANASRDRASGRPAPLRWFLTAAAIPAWSYTFSAYRESSMMRTGSVLSVAYLSPLKTASRAFDSSSRMLYRPVLARCKERQPLRTGHGRRQFSFQQQCYFFQGRIGVLVHQNLQCTDGRVGHWGGTRRRPAVSSKPRQQQRRESTRYSFREARRSAPPELHMIITKYGFRGVCSLSKVTVFNFYTAGTRGGCGSA